MESGLDGRVALITGGGSGIGLATARVLAGEGCRLLLADLAPDRAVAELSELDAELEGVVCDVSSPEQARAAVQRAVERFGRLDVLVASAGIYETSDPDQLSDEQWQRTLEVNLSGTFMCAREAIAAMAVNGWGRVVTLSSMAAQTGGDAAGAAYVASKAGVMGLTRSLAKHGGPQGVTVNCVNPGLIETPMTGEIDSGPLAKVAASTPLGRNGTAQDVAYVIAMLCTEGAGFVTGCHVNVNGGLVMD